MMLIKSSLPSSIDAGISSVSDHGKQNLLHALIRDGGGTWQESTECGRHPHTDHLSTATNMTESSTPTFVYKRRKKQSNPFVSERSPPALVYKRRRLQGNSSSIFPAKASTITRLVDNCFSANSSEALSAAVKDHVVSIIDVEDGMSIAYDLLPDECCRLDLDSKLGSVDGVSLGAMPGIADDPKDGMRRGSDICTINDSCSSSKSNLDLGSDSLKPHLDDVGECSSSGALVTEGLGEDISHKDQCISFLRSHGALKGTHPKICASAKSTGTNKNNICFMSCQVCDQLEMTPKMLLCDHCEGAFHVSCCKPSVENLPVDEWFCHSCLRKKVKKLKETSTSNSFRDKTLTSMDESGPIAFMLTDTEPYTTQVRIGRDFQAEVPDWSGPLANEDNLSLPLEMTSLECASYQDTNSAKSSRLSSIGNWLQCREVVDGLGEGVDGTICGKWRRAPLFEVQTDDWDCFHSVLWDPTHSDCAVPQELETDQVLKHLKYIETDRITGQLKATAIALPSLDDLGDSLARVKSFQLRARLAATRCKLGVTRGGDSEDHSKDLRSSQTL